MRILLLLLVFSASCCFVASDEKTTSSTTTTTSTTAKITTKAAASASKPATSKAAKQLGDARGKRTLFDFGNYDYLQPQQIDRRIGGISYPETSSYYSNGINGGGNGGYQQQLIQYPSFISEPSNHLPHDYRQGGYYPQYLEAPEPIIEIIIKEANETINAPPPQPIVQKKKKEKVQVFYVNYKKDKNNKLHLETPIASLEHNNHHDELEEEEILQYATPLPPVKTTTLRTIIHPDSEQYHSNSGIHVSFGTEDKHQHGHQLQEHNEESVIRSVVAIPNNGNNFIHGALEKPHHHHHHQLEFNAAPNFQTTIDHRFLGPSPQTQSQTQFRTDYSQSRTINSFNGNAQNNFPPAQHYVTQQLQLPASHQAQQFRNFINQYQITHTPPPFHQQHQQQQQHQTGQFHVQKKIQQQRPTQSFPPLEIIQQYNPNLRPELHQEQRPQGGPNQPQFFQHQHQEFTSRLQSQQQLQKSTTFPTKQSVRFPFQSAAPHKHQSLPHQYQSVSFRPTPQQQHQKPILSNGQQHKQQQQQLKPKPTQKPFNAFPIFGLSQSKPTPPTTKPDFGNFNKFNQQQQQFKQTTKFISSTQPTRPAIKHTQPTPSRQEHFQSNYNTNSGFQNGFVQQQQQHDLAPIQSLFGPTQSELVSSVPKFETHITEYVNNPQPQQQQQIFQNDASLPDTKIRVNEFSFKNKNQVIQHIPAPKLGPTSPNPLVHQSSLPTSASSSSGRFGSSSTTEYNSFDQQQQQFFSSTPQYTQTERGQQHISIVTPQPNTQFTFNQQQSQFYNGNSGGQPIIIPNSQPQQQQQQNFQQQNQNQYSLNVQFEQQQQQLQQQQQQEQQQSNQQPENYVSINARNKFSINHQTQSPTEVLIKPTTYSPKSTPNIPTTHAPTTSTSTMEISTSAKQNHLNLPDEVPEELRQQLLSSGILDNADISVLDYDKVGDVALENLPPEHLAHFYGNGGAAQIAGSHKILSVVKPNGDKVNISEKQLDKVKQTQAIPKRHNVDLKVVRFDSTNQKSITDKYIKTDSTVLPTMNVGSTEKQYNRYLPLKVSGAHFPIPDVDELRGKKISSVVVLAPVDTQQQQQQKIESRQERDFVDSKSISFIAGDSLKQLIKKPTTENFKKWLDKESKTEIDLQSVVLLVTKNSDNEKEIYMYDIGTQSINKLNGELSTAFVNVAEENASTEDLENVKITDSGIVERMSTNSGEEEEEDLEPEGSSNYETIVKYSSPVGQQSQNSNQKISINSGYSSIKN